MSEITRIEYFVYLCGNPKYSAYTSSQWENFAVWEPYSKLEDFLGSTLFDEKCDLARPVYMDSDKYCPICTRCHTVRPIDRVHSWGVTMCDICFTGSFSDNVRDFTVMAAYNGRPICVIYRNYDRDNYTSKQMEEETKKLLLLLSENHPPLTEEQFDVEFPMDDESEWIRLGTSKDGWRLQKITEQLNKDYLKLKTVFTDIFFLDYYGDDGAPVLYVLLDVWKTLSQEEREIMRSFVTAEIEKNNIMTTLPKTIGDDVFDPKLLSRARGCLLGQFCGDALGSLVEFHKEETVKRLYPDGVKEMHDGGRWNSVAGQLTDDSEMALMLIASILKDGTYNAQTALKHYIYWVNTSPTDVGRTTAKALVAARAAFGAELRWEDILEYIDQHGGTPESQANGALMRVSPLAIWGVNQDPNRLAEYAIADARLTHINRVCHECNGAYIVALHHAINHGHIGAYEAAVKWLQANGKEPEVMNRLVLAAKEPPKNFFSYMGWVLTAFQNAFYHLVNTDTAEKAIVETVGHGGDSDTNGCIVGALIGAARGVETLNMQWIDKVLNCRPESGNPLVKKPRPKEFWPVDALILVDKLLAIGMWSSQ